MAHPPDGVSSIVFVDRKAHEGQSAAPCGDVPRWLFLENSAWKAARLRGVTQLSWDAAPV